MHARHVVAIDWVPGTGFPPIKRVYEVDPDEESLVTGPRRDDKACDKASDPEHVSRLNPLISLNKSAAIR